MPDVAGLAKLVEGQQYRPLFVTISGAHLYGFPSPDSDVDLRGDVWQLRTGRYVVVRWQDECRSTHSEAAVEYDASRSRAEWSRNLSHEDR